MVCAGSQKFTREVGVDVDCWHGIYLTTDEQLTANLLHERFESDRVL